MERCKHIPDHMKIDVARQPLGLVLITSIAVIFLSALKSVYAPAVEAVPYAGSPMAEFVENMFRGDILRYAAIIIILAVNALLLTRIMVIYKANFGRGFLCAAMYMIAAAVIVSPYGSITGPLAAMLLVISSDQAVSAFRRNYRFEAVFKSAFALGFVPLLYPAAITLWLIFPVILALYQRTLREIVVAIAGLLLPFLLCSTAWWSAGYAWGYLFESFILGLTSPQGESVSTLAGGDMFALLLAGLYLIIAAASVVLLSVSYNKYPNRVRKVYVHLTALLLCCIPMYFIPSGDLSVSASLTAVPLSVVGTHFFIRANKWIGLGVYIVLLVLAIAAVI